MVSAAAPAPHPPPGSQAPPPRHNEAQLKALAINALRLSAVGERLGAHFLGVGILGPHEIAHLVYAFARFASTPYPPLCAFGVS
jgi:E3 SUMO-protein ligase PIAS1